MASIRFNIRDVEYTDHPWFGEADFFSYLKRGQKAGNLPLFSHKHLDHCSRSEFLDRSKLSNVLQHYNRLVGNPLDNITIDNIQSQGRFVLTGHQPVLLTGPLFTFLKAVSVISLSRRLENSAQTPLIPAIWIASEDHDVLEVNRCSISGRQFVWDYPGTIQAGQMPQVGDINLKACREPLLNFLKDTLPHNDFQGWVLDMVSSCRFDDYGRLFASLLQRMFADWKIVFIDSLAVRALTAPVLASIVEQWTEIEKAFEAGKDMLREQGFTPPLSVLNIFEVENGKRVKCRLTRQGFGLSTGVKNFRSAADEIRTRPLSFSPGAGLRPLVQDAVIPVMVYIGGPEELLYSWQLTPLYDVAAVTRSKLLPRISATFIEKSIKKAAAHAGLYPDQIFYADDYLKKYKPDTAVLDEIDEINVLGRELLTGIDRFKNEHNKKWLQKSKDAIQHHLDKLRNKLAEEKLHEIGLGKKYLEKISNAVMPAGKLQERMTNVLQLLGSYGPSFISLSLESFDPEKLCHQIAEIEVKP